MTRRLVWMQLLIGWFPMYALLVALVVTAHGTTLSRAALAALPSTIAAALLGLIVHRLTERFPWPRHVTPLFVISHLAAALVFAGSWILLNGVFETVRRGSPSFVLAFAIGPFIVTGIWFYVMIAGVSYTAQATERAARAEAEAARSQLAALRSQLNPHFLFNALHTVVQLIPREPRQAAYAAEELAAVLRVTVEEDRDIVTVAEEMAFVKRYLGIERLRFGERLGVRIDVSEAALEATVPSFAVQTLIENAVQHGVSPRVEPTEVVITGEIFDDMLQVRVVDDGAGVAAGGFETGGTGLRRLRDRLSALYGKDASLEIVTGGASSGFAATLFVRQEHA